MQNQTENEQEIPHNESEINNKIKESSTTFIGISGILLTLLITAISTIDFNQQDATFGILKSLFVLATVCLTLSVIVGITTHIDIFRHKTDSGIKSFVYSYLLTICGIICISTLIITLIYKSAELSKFYFTIALLVSIKITNLVESKAETIIYLFLIIIAVYYNKILLLSIL